jgi:hypothetical protein
MRVALLRLNHALDCDSRQSNIIKSLIDRLHEEVLRPPPPRSPTRWCFVLTAYAFAVSQRPRF